MHGLGNDFVVIDGIQQSVNLTPELCRALADRNWGIGCDQILLVEKVQQANAELLYRIFNADGSEVEHCGNGARCFAKFVQDKGLSHNNPIAVATNAGIIELEVKPDGQVTVAMGVPEFQPSSIPFEVPSDEASNTYVLPLVDGDIAIASLALGNPHAVHKVDNIQQAPVADYGPQIESHRQFPRRVNAGFVEVLDRKNIAVRVYERGVGETQACGTGACAAMVACHRWGLVDNDVNVQLTGGNLHISWHGDGSQVMMTGPATTVFSGEIDVQSLI